MAQHKDARANCFEYLQEPSSCMLSRISDPLTCITTGPRPTKKLTAHDRLFLEAPAEDPPALCGLLAGLALAFGVLLFGADLPFVGTLIVLSSMKARIKQQQQQQQQYKGTQLARVYLPRIIKAFSARSRRVQVA